MAKFLIEVPHDAGHRACAPVVQIYLNAGSHFLTHADWGCKDGEHKAWMVVDVGNKDEARSIVPPAFRSQAKIVMLTCLTTGRNDVSDPGQIASRYR